MSTESAVCRGCNRYVEFCICGVETDDETVETPDRTNTDPDRSVRIAARRAEQREWDWDNPRCPICEKQHPPDQCDPNDRRTAMKPEYVYVASSWRNPIHAGVCAALGSAGIAHYDFKNPGDNSGFSWREVKSENGPASTSICEHCAKPIVYSTFRGMGGWEPDYDPSDDPTVWRHGNGYGSCMSGDGKFAMPKKGSDLEQVDEYLRMVAHPRALEGFAADFAAMQRADTFVLVLPCGKSAHLELGWAVGAGKRTAILLEDPIEPELMYRMVDYLAPSLFDLLGWLGVDDEVAA